MSDLEEILNEALRLDTDSRAELIERLLASLGTLSNNQAEEAWLEEAERRLQAYREGAANAKSAREVFNKARQKELLDELTEEAEKLELGY